LWHVAVLLRDKKQVGVLNEERMFDVDGKGAVCHCWNPKFDESYATPLFWKVLTL
jgi:hypothetical protein